MEDFLANGPVEQILGLMGMVIAGAVILGGFIVFNVMRSDSGGKKAKMKLGSSGKKPAPKQADDDLNLDVLGKKKAEPEPSLMDLSSRLSDLNEPDEPAAQVSEPPAAPLQAAPEPQTNVTVESTGQPEELLRLLRDAESGDLIVEIAGKQYRKLAEITDKKIGTFILRMAAHLLAFTNGMVATAAGVKSLGAVKAGKVPPPVASSPPAQTAPQPPQPAYNPSDPPPFMDTRPNQRLAAYQEIKSTFTGPPADAASRKKGGGLLSALGPSAPIEDAPLLDLASEINKIVQTRLKYTRLSSAARVEITNNPDGGIRIGVDNRVYNSPDDIPDPEIKSLIKDSIQEWEQS